MPGWIYPFIWLFLWLIQSRLANQHSITKLLHGGSLIGFNLHNGGTLGKWGLNCFSISPSCRLDRFMDLKRVRHWFYLFHYSFTGLLHPKTSKLSVCDNHGRNISPVLDYARCRESNLRWEWENRFICRCRPLEAIHPDTRKSASTRTALWTQYWLFVTHELFERSN